jgi:uncharacterized protein YciI
MKKAILALMLFFGMAVAAQQGPLPADFEIPTNMKQYFVVFYVQNAKSQQAHQDHAMMKQHLQFIRSQAEAGKIALAGPFTDNGKIGGIFILDVPTADDAKKLIAGDLVASSGAADVEIHRAMLPDMSPVKFVYAPKKAQ